VRVRIAGFDRVLVVRELIAKRVGAPDAAKAYSDITPPRAVGEEFVRLPRRDRGTGRPTKRERRELERLRDRRDDLG
jgi:ribosome-associated heat shock protein Hsp15